MGGYGSTRWRTHYKKRLVEGCYSIDILDFERKGILNKPGYLGYNIWYDKRTGKEIASIGIEVELRQDGVYVLYLKYNVSNDYGQEKIGIPVYMCTSRTYFGGTRKWFICPITINGKWCGRRVRKLYLPQDEKYFGCRHCHRLTYLKTQERGKKVYWWYGFR